MEEGFIKSGCLAEVQLTYKSKVKPSDRPKISKANDAYTLLKTIYNPDTVEHVESFIVMMLNRANKVIGWASISTGGTSSTVVDPKIVFQLAINSNASAIVLSHNHPSGNLKPSDVDIQLTKKIKEGAKLLDITLMDHLIFTTEGYYSFAEEGLI